MQSPNQAQNFSGGMMDGLGPKLEMLKGMPDHQLQQVAHDAQMRNDITTLIACQQIDSERKNLRSNSQSQAPMQQPPVATQVANNIGKPPMQPPMQPQGQMPPPGGMPPPQGQPMMHAGGGLTQLPAGNIGMAGGGIVAFDKGGTTQDAGSDPTLAYQQYAQTHAQQMGLDPQFVDNIFKTESGYKPNADSGNNHIGIGQISPLIANHYGAGADTRTDPYKNIDASLGYMADLKKKYGTYDKVAVGYNQGEPYLNDHLKTNAGQVNPDGLNKEATGYYKKVVAPFLTAMAPGANAQAAEQVGPPANAAPKPTSAAPKGGGIFDLSKYKADPGYKPPHDVRLPVPMYGSNATQPADPRTVTGQLDGLRAMGGQGAANQANYPGHGISELEAQGVADDNGQLDRLRNNHPVTNIGGSSFDEPAAPAAGAAGQAAGAVTTDDNGGLFGLSKRELLLAGLAGLKNAGPHWQNMVGSMGEGLVQAKNEQAAQAKAALEQAQSQYFMNRGKYYDTLSDPKLQEMIHQHGSGNELAAEKLVQTHMAQWAKDHNASLENLMKDPQMAQLTQAEEARYRANLPQQPGAGTVASAPSPGWGAAKPNS